MTTRIRKARRQDAATVAALLGELGYPCTCEQALERLRLLSGRRNEAMLVAELDGDVVGIAACRIEHAIELQEPICHLTALVVASGARGRGAGGALVQAVEQIARRRGCARLTLSSGNWRPDAHRFYEALGFEETGRRFAKRLP